MKFEGIMTALITPLHEDGRVDEQQLRELVRLQINNQVNSLLVLGGTGEYAALSNDERKRAIDIVVNETNKKIPVAVGILSTGLGDAIEIGQYAKAAGAEAILVVTPYYVIPNQQGIIDYYKKLDKAVDMPMLIYNIPYRTGVNALPETVEKLVEEIPNIIGIKECEPSFNQFTDLIRRVGDKITVLSGDEFLAVTEFIYGAKGAIMATANLIPDVWVKMWNLVNEGKIEEAVNMNIEYYPLFKAIFKETNPGPLKEALKMAGLPAGYLSTPLTAPNADTLEALKQAMRAMSLLK